MCFSQDNISPGLDHITATSYVRLMLEAKIQKLYLKKQSAENNKKNHILILLPCVAHASLKE